MTIDENQVTRIASLARLSLDADTSRRVAGELTAILDYIDQLATLDTTGIEPTAHLARIDTPMRPDVVVPSLGQERAVSAAPVAAEGYFVVPQIIEGGG